MILRHQGHRTDIDAAFLRQSDPQISFGVGGVGCQFKFKPLPVRGVRTEHLGRVNRFSAAVRQREFHFRRSFCADHRRRQIGPARLDRQIMLTDAGFVIRAGVHHDLTVHLQRPLHVIVLGVLRVSVQGGHAENALFADGIPPGCTAAAGGGLAGEFSVAQHLRRKTVLDIGAGVLQVHAEQGRGDKDIPGGIQLQRHGSGVILTARLADGLFRLAAAGRIADFSAQDLNDADLQLRSQSAQQGDIRQAPAPFPFGDRLVGHVQPPGQLCLGHTQCGASFADQLSGFAHVHTISSFLASLVLRGRILSSSA